MNLYKRISTHKVRCSRTGSATEALYQSIKTHGILEHLVVGPGNVLQDGAARLEVAKALGLKTVPVMITDKIECWFKKSDIRRAIKRLLGMGMTLKMISESSGRSLEWLKEELK